MFCVMIGGFLCFNEAAGMHRRKHILIRLFNTHVLRSFNEAAGIHRRKLLSE